MKARTIKGRHSCPVCGQLVFFTRRGRPYHQHLRGKAHIEAERAAKLAADRIRADRKAKEGPR